MAIMIEMSPFSLCIAFIWKKFIAISESMDAIWF